MYHTPAEAQAHLAAIITSSDDAIIGKDLNGTITSWNEAAERIFGYQADEAIGRHISMIIPSERISEEEYIIGKIRKGERVNHFETQRRAKNGTLMNISVTVSPIKNAEGVIVGASKVARDITDRINTERRLHELSMKKDEFLANMSHELRTPMNAVIGLANLLRTSKSLSERDRQFVDTLKVSADNLMDLINDLLDFAKIESGSVQLEGVEFDLLDTMRRAVQVMQVRANEKGLTMELRTDENLNRYYIGDPLRIHQMVMNLLSNAVKFTERGGITIELLGRSDPNADLTHVGIRVSDTGIGIARDKLESVFEKFIQADASITRRYGGSGLGLAITRALAEKMGGTVEVESELGLGTTFTLTLPLRNTEQQGVSTMAGAMQEDAPVAAHKHVLLVEDYQPNVMVAGTILEQLGYAYDVAPNGVEAIRRFLQRQYDVILMDVQMQELDGLETTRRIRRMEQERGLVRTPIIAMTAHVREQDKNQCLESGMDDFVPKPFDPQILAEKLARFINAEEALQTA